MCEAFQDSFPLPEIDFDEYVIIRLNENIVDYPKQKINSNVEEIVQTFGFRLSNPEPIKATKDSSVYKSFCQYFSEDPNTTLVEEYALKVSKKKFRIQREYDNFQLLPKSPYLVQSYDLFEATDLIILQMELCERDILGLSFDDNSVCKLIHDVASALDVIHSSGFLHLDVSPSNILIKGNQFKLADFGTVIENGTFQRGDEGAGPYVSPEIFAFPGNPKTGYVIVTPSTDIFSFGVVLLEILSGFFAPRGGHPKYTALRNGQVKLNDGTYQTNCSPHLVSLVNQMLSPDPLLRPTAHQILMHPMIRELR